MQFCQQNNLAVMNPCFVALCYFNYPIGVGFGSESSLEDYRKIARKSHEDCKKIAKRPQEDRKKTAGRLQNCIKIEEERKKIAKRSQKNRMKIA